jgi:two-component system, chemotaxis family, protein-glutamate methylesterase/glutaminase
MPARDIIVIGTSTGGIEATKVLVGALPRGLKASLFIVLHIGADGLGLLPEILEQAGCLPASNAKNGEVFEPGHIYVAPPDHHLLLEQPCHLRVARGPKENRFRPAVDPLFRSAAYAFGPRVIGVILTGGLDDGTAGLRSIKARGGTAIVQDPSEALAPSMPLSALRRVAVDYSMRLEEIAPLLVKLSRVPVEEKRAIPLSKQMETEVNIAKEANAVDSGIMDWGEPSYS